MRKLVVVLCLIVLSGCSPGEGAHPRERSEGQTFTIGLIPEQNIFKQIERYTPVAAYLSQKTGLKVELKVLTRYGNIIDNFVSEGMDGAFLGSFTYALAHMRLGLEVVARPEALDGSSTYYGLIFVRKDSGIQGASDMRGKRFAFVDKATTAGYLLPLAYFKTQGIHSYKTFLKEFYFTGTHEDAIYDVFHKKADVGAAKNTVFERLSSADERVARELKILATSPKVPENGLALKKSIDPSLKKAIAETLLSMQNDPAGRSVLRKFGVRRFIPTSDKDYEPVYRYAREIGLDLARYDYLND